RRHKRSQRDWSSDVCSSDLLIVCALSWLVLLGSLITACTGLPQPRSPSDIVVIVVIAVATAVFARLGLVSIIALLLRTLPDGREIGRAWGRGRVSLCILR